MQSWLDFSKGDLANIHSQFLDEPKRPRPSTTLGGFSESIDVPEFVAAPWHLDEQADGRNSTNGAALQARATRHSTSALDRPRALCDGAQAQHQKRTTHAGWQQFVATSRENCGVNAKSEVR